MLATGLALLGVALVIYLVFGSHAAHGSEEKPDPSPGKAYGPLKPGEKVNIDGKGSLYNLEVYIPPLGGLPYKFKGLVRKADEDFLLFEYPVQGDEFHVQGDEYFEELYIPKAMVRSVKITHLTQAESTSPKGRSLPVQPGR